MSIAAPPKFIGIPLTGRISGFRRFTVPEYHKLIEIGLLTEDDDLELLDGHLVKKISRNPPHDGTLKKLEKRIARTLPAGWDTRVQMAFSLVNSEPEPDLLIARNDPDEYMTRHPDPTDLGILIEVANTTLNSDRNDKAPVYALAGVAEFWIVNITQSRIEVYTQPDPQTYPPAYRKLTVYDPGQTIPLNLDGQHLADLPVDELLP